MRTRSRSWCASGLIIYDGQAGVLNLDIRRFFVDKPMQKSIKMEFVNKIIAILMSTSYILRNGAFAPLETKEQRAMSNQPISFRFNAKKSAQAAYKLLVLSGGQRNYMELVKLLYLSDREALLRLDRPITGDRLAALPYGPVLSHILNLIKWGPMIEDDAPWFEAVSPPLGYEVKALADCGEDDLSGAECQLIDHVFENYGRKDWKELSRLTHQLPEYVDPKGGCIPISLEQILKLEGRPQSTIERIRDEIASYEVLDRELSAYQEQEFEVSADMMPA